MFIDLPDFQHTIYYMGIPYIVESAFRGHLLAVLDQFEESIDPILEGKILQKYIICQNAEAVIEQKKE